MDLSHLILCAGTPCNISYPPTYYLVIIFGVSKVKPEKILLLIDIYQEKSEKDSIIMCYVNVISVY